MKKNINIPNIYKDIELWEGNILREYISLDLKTELNSETPIISVQKSALETLDLILKEFWLKWNDCIKLEDAIWRSWFTKIISPKYGQLWIIATKGEDSTKLFSNISNFYLWGSDIGEKTKAMWLELSELSKIPWKILWKYKTELLFILWINTINQIWWNLENFEIDKIATKFTPILTRNAINELPSSMKIPEIETVDSNSELAIQVLEWKGYLIWWVEIVQSWNSLIATNNAVIRDWTMYMPSIRDDEWNFIWEIISEIDPASQIWIISNSIQTDIDLILYKILNKSENKKPIDFIKKISEVMENISI